MFIFALLRREKVIHKEFKMLMLCGFFSVQFSWLIKKELLLKGVDLESTGLVVTNLVPSTVKTTYVTS